MVRVIQRLSDLDRSIATDTVPLAIDDRAVLLDLTDEQAKELRELLAPYMDAAAEENRLGTIDILHSAKKGSAPSSRHQTTEWYRTHMQTDTPREKRLKKKHRDKVKAWARTQGYEVSNYGIMPRRIFVAYEQYCDAIGESHGPESVGL